MPRALVGLSVPCSALCSPRLAQPPWPRGRDLCDRCRRYEVLSPLRFASNDYWSLESRVQTTQQPWLGVEAAQPRFGSARERCVAGPQYHSSRCTELASCKDTRSTGALRDRLAALQSARSRTPRPALPFVLETARWKFPAAAPRPAQATSSASHLAPRAQLAAQPTRRPPNARRSARRQRARAATHCDVRLRGI